MNPLLKPTPKKRVASNRDTLIQSLLDAWKPHKDYQPHPDVFPEYEIPGVATIDVLIAHPGQQMLITSITAYCREKGGLYALQTAERSRQSVNRAIVIVSKEDAKTVLRSRRYFDEAGIGLWEVCPSQGVTRHLFGKTGLALNRGKHHILVKAIREQQKLSIPH